jgi:uncharacterized protein YuzB (UPF0349 family)
MFSYSWTTVDGNIVSGETTLTPVVDVVGSYVLSVLNSENGCSETASVSVTEDGAVPSLLIAPADELTCVVDELELDASGSSSGARIDVLWKTVDGNIVSGGTNLQPTVN